MGLDAAGSGWFARGFSVIGAVFGDVTGVGGRRLAFAVLVVDVNGDGGAASHRGGGGQGGRRYFRFYQRRR